MKNTSNNLQKGLYFSTPVYVIDKPEFLSSVKKVSEEFLKKSKDKNKIDEIYPVIMTENYFSDSRISEFCKYVAQSAWNILDEQGYNMENYGTYFTEMWTQEHYKMSMMDQHIHGYGSQIVGFYFLETPKDCSRLVVYDPRPSKVQINLPQKKDENITDASIMVNFEPKAGQLIFTNSWLAHSFTKNASSKPMKFVHFNLAVQYNAACNIPSGAEVI